LHSQSKGIIGVGRCCSQNLGRGFGRLIATTGLLEDERIVIIHIIHNQVNGRSFQRLVSSPELLNDVGVTAVEDAQEEHDKKKRRNDNLALSHFQNETNRDQKATIGSSLLWSEVR
jgi:hypothetical protein